MSAWTVTPAEQTLIDEFDYLNEERDKGADGTIGDSSHDPTSDHTPDEDSSSLKNRDSDNVNEVHAVDIDSTGPWPNTTFDKIINYVTGECRKPNDVGKDYGRIRYIIWNHYIYQAKNGWVKENYTGSDPHTNHAHFSFEYDTGHYENDTRPYGIAETFGDSMTLDDDDIKRISDEVKRLMEKDGAIARGLRQQPNNLSDTERGYTAKAVDTQIKPYLDTINTKLDALTQMFTDHVSGIIEGEKK